MTVEVYCLPDANKQDTKDFYSKQIRHAVQERAPHFVIQSYEAWAAYFDDKDEYDGRPISEQKHKKEIVQTNMYANIYGQILTITATKEVHRDDAGKVDSLAERPLSITHKTGSCGGRLFPFSDLLPEIS